MNISIYNYDMNLSKCSNDGTEITLGYEIRHAQKIFNDDKFNMFLSDTITHELIHAILIKEYDLTVSKLFDTIEHHIGTYELKECIFEYLQDFNNSRFPMTWHNSILNEGIQLFFKDYWIHKNDLIQSYIICNGRIK